MIERYIRPGPCCEGRILGVMTDSILEPLIKFCSYEFSHSVCFFGFIARKTTTLYKTIIYEILYQSTNVL